MQGNDYKNNHSSIFIPLDIFFYRHPMSVDYFVNFVTLCLNYYLDDPEGTPRIRLPAAGRRE